MAKVELVRRYYRSAIVDIDIPEGTEDPIDYIDNLPNIQDYWDKVDNDEESFEESDINILED